MLRHDQYFVSVLVHRDVVIFVEIVVARKLGTQCQTLVKGCLKEGVETEIQFLVLVGDD